jgi:hypothetical protein
MTMTDPLKSVRELLSLREASQLLPGKPHISTLHRWRLRGIRGVKLITVMVGGRRWVHPDALRDFNAAITAAREPGAANAGPPTRTTRTRTVKKAEQTLSKEGI